MEIYKYIYNINISIYIKLISLNQNKMNIVKKKYKQEKRRRFHTYVKLDYIVNMSNLIDFLSSDLLILIQVTTFFQEFFKKEIDNSLNSLIFSFLTFQNSATDLILKKTDLKIKHSIKYFFNTISEDKINLYLKDLKHLKNLNFRNSSKDLNKLLVFSADFTFNSLKTPVISTKIFFLYILDYLYFLNSSTKKIENSENYLKFLTQRFCFLKEIYKEELYLRNKIPTSQIYFAYLLKIHLSDFEYNRLIELNLLNLAVENFRNILISKITKINIFETLTNDVTKTLKLNKERTYTL